MRDALDQPREQRSILEEGADGARHKLTQLINDATLMWQDICELDTRSRASREVAAASIYAKFRDRFLDAMASLSRELGHLRGIGDEGCAIVLPIDNIDRSTDHLYSIVKLAQMVSCRQLWLVMAGDRQDVETFLERAFWKELVQIGETSGASGKPDAGGEDEALVMARRQAAAALHKLLPPSNRVEVQLVRPEDTLKFSSSAGAEHRNEDMSISALLARIPLSRVEPSCATASGGTRLQLVDLFNAWARISKARDPTWSSTGKRC